MFQASRRKPSGPGLLPCPYCWLAISGTGGAPIGGGAGAATGCAPGSTITGWPGGALRPAPAAAAAALAVRLPGSQWPARPSRSRRRQARSLRPAEVRRCVRSYVACVLPARAREGCCRLVTRLTRLRGPRVVRAMSLKSLGAHYTWKRSAMGFPVLPVLPMTRMVLVALIMSRVQQPETRRFMR